MYSFKYSPRPNTLAVKRLPDDVLESDKTRRIMALQAQQAQIQLGLFQSQVGQVVEVLVESKSRRRDHELAGRTDGWTLVNFAGPAEWVGQFRQVRITGAAPNSLRGEVVEGSDAH